MRIAIVTYMGFDGPGVMHAHHFANCLSDKGHEVLMLLNGRKRSVRAMQEAPRYQLAEVSFSKGLLVSQLRSSVEEFGPHIVHLWTPRHLSARVGLEAWECSNARLLIHYEDDEEFVLEHFGGGSRFADNDLELYRFLRRADPDLDHMGRFTESLDLDFLRMTLLEPSTWHWLHPFVSPLAEKLANGNTVISAPYLTYLKERTDQPAHLLYPGVDLERFHPRDKPKNLERRLRLENRIVLLYSGAIAAIHDFPEYLRALPTVVADYPEVLLLQIGRNDIVQHTDALVHDLGIENNLLLVDHVPHHRMADYLALADVFLAHVRVDRFNEHRLPSKIPEYMAMGRPMVVADHGFGRELRDGDEVVKLGGDSPEEVAKGLLRLLELRDSWPEMGARLRNKAARLFNWHRNTDHLLEFYEKILAAEPLSLREGLGVDTTPVDVTQLGYTESMPPRRDAVGRDRSRKGVVIFTDGRIGDRMSGTGIRYFEIARALAGRFEVALGHRYPDRPRSAEFEVFQWVPENPAPALERARAAEFVLTHGFVLDKLPGLKEIDGYLIVDLYCPWIFENLEIHHDRGLDLGKRQLIHENDLRVLRDQLSAGDHFLCSTDRQRDWVLGLLTAMNRIHPETYDRDRDPESLVSIVPFGLSEEYRTAESGRVLKGRWAGVSPTDTVLLWGGGIWSWLDPLTVIRAMRLVSEERDDVKLVFLSTQTADDLVTMPLKTEAMDLAKRLRLDGESVIFNRGSYIDYADRGRYFSESDIGVCAHVRSLETHYAFRTRILDYINFGLPVLTSRGDFLGDYVEQNRIGRAVELGDEGAWAEAILDMVARPETLAGYRERAQAHRKHFAWPRVTQPLLEYCRRHEGVPNGRRSDRKLAVYPGAWAEDQGAVAASLQFSGEEIASTPAEELVLEAQRRLELLADRCADLQRQVAAKEREKEKILETVRVMSQQIGLIRKIPLATQVWQLIKRVRRMG